MDPIESKKAWLVAPVALVLFAIAISCVWAALPAERLIPLFDNKGHSPVELMTLPLFALIVPLVWLCPPQGGSARRKCGWSLLWSVLAVMALVRETDVHKMLFAKIWPDIVFKGTVFKMKFLKAADIPLCPKLFVLAFFVCFFVAVAVPLVRYFVPLVRGFFRREPVAWSAAFFGIAGTMVMTVDRLPANLRHAGFDGPLLDRDAGALTALLKAFEEGGEMMMALFALLALLQSYLIFGRKDSQA